MTLRGALPSLAIVALALASIGGDCTLGGGGPMIVMPVHRPANVDCGAATPVMDGTSLTVQDTAEGSDTFAAACLGRAVGPVLYYEATIPAGATLTGTTSGPSSLRILSGCGASSCLASDAAKSSSGVTVALTNASS